jgi:GntR family transcriptional regulator, rspAB operon transcriptional repressor
MPEISARHVASSRKPSRRPYPSRQTPATVYDSLREAIVSLALAPGQAINRIDLQNSFGVSSTPVRDALLRLAAEGLVDVVPQSATRVSLIDISKAREAQFLRRAIELEAVKTISEAADKAIVAELRGIIAQQKTAAAAEDYPTFDARDSEFHRRIYEAAGVLDLYQLVRQHSGHIDRIRRLHLPVPGKMQEVIRAHGLIVKAIAAGDAEEAQFRTRDHLSRSLAYIPSLRERHPGSFKE